MGNFNVPTWEDLGYAANPSWRVHAMPIGRADIPAITRFSKGCPRELELEWAEQVAYLTLRGAYPAEINADLSEARTDLDIGQFDQVIDSGLLDEKPENVKVEGIVRVFLRGEPSKIPPRNRLINHTKSVNDVTVADYCRLTNAKEVRASIYDGDYCYSIDLKCGFHQFAYGREVQPLFCVWHPVRKKWYMLSRLAMGQRQAVKICHTALKVLAYGCRSPNLPYVDNLKGTGAREDLIHDLIRIRERAEACNITFGEDLTKPEELVVQIAPFLGLVLDHRPEEKTVCIVEKTINKLKFAWDNRDRWTHNHFISCVSICLYTFLATRRNLGKYQFVLQQWAKVQGDCVREPMLRKAPIEIGDATMKVLTEWVGEVSINAPVKVDEATHQPDFYVLSDACIWGYGGIVISAKSGQATVIQGKWRPELTDYCSSSARSEPLGMLAVLSEFFTEPGVRARITHYGDNQGSENIVNKGYSTKDSQVVMEALARELPGLTVNSKYTPGATLPADRVSRAEDASEDEVRTFCQEKGIPFSGIRDICVVPPKHKGFTTN